VNDGAAKFEIRYRLIIMPDTASKHEKSERTVSDTITTADSELERAATAEEN
jgi:hypothetical protein